MGRDRWRGRPGARGGSPLRRRPTAKPRYAEIRADDAGGVWISRPGRYGAGGSQPPPEWWIFSPDGEWLADASMPEGIEVLAIGEGWALGTTVDSLDVQSVRVHAIER